MKNNPFLPEDSWKNKARLESIKIIQERERAKQRQKVQELVADLIKKLPK